MLLKPESIDLLILGTHELGNKEAPVYFVKDYDIEISVTSGPVRLFTPYKRRKRKNHPKLKVSTNVEVTNSDNIVSAPAELPSEDVTINGVTSDAVSTVTVPLITRDSNTVICPDSVIVTPETKSQVPKSVPSALDINEQKQWWQLEENGLYLKGSICDIPCLFLVDTGTNITLLRADLAHKVKERLIYTAPNLTLKTATDLEKNEIRTGSDKISLFSGSTQYRKRTSDGKNVQSRRLCFEGCEPCSNAEKKFRTETDISVEALTKATENRWSLSEIQKAQLEDPDIRPILKMKLNSADRPSWQEIAHESPATKRYWAL
ncbi:hypothetical protein AVEN_127506-1, partial [Araneus ventricosus]